MAERVVGVILPGRSCRELRGPAADLVALVATVDLSARTLRMLCQLVAHEPDLAAIVYGRVEVDLTPNRAALSERKAFPKRAYCPQPGDPDAA